MIIDEIKQAKYVIDSNVTLLNGEKYNLMVLPAKFSNTRLTCKISDTTCAEINALRRIAIDEFPMKIMQVDLNKSFTSRCSTQFCEELAGMIYCIPIDQTLNYDNVTITLDVKNTNIATKMAVRTTALMIGNKPNSGLNAICNDFPLTVLAPSEELKLFITVVTKSRFGGACAAHSCAFTPIKPIERVNGIPVTPISQNNLDTEFTFFMETNGNITPYEVLTKSLDILSARFDDLAKILKDNLIKISESQYKLLMFTENSTTGKLLSDYLFDNTRKYFTNISLNDSVPNRTELLLRVDNADVKVYDILLEALVTLAKKYKDINVGKLTTISSKEMFSNIPY